MNVEEAEKFIDQYFARYPKVQVYQDELLKKAKHDGYVASILGRRRKFDPSAIRERTSYHSRNQAEREAINMEIQGSAADVIKMAMLKVDASLRSEGLKSRMLLQVHDELVFEVAPGERDALEKLVRRDMGSAVEMAVPLDVSVGVGRTWHEAAH